MTMKEKNEMLHAVSDSAFSELADDKDPTRIPKTDEEIRKDRFADADSIDSNL